MTDDLLILILWEVGVIAFGIWAQIVIKEVFDAIHGTPIPDNATNGDVIKAMFPQMNINEEWKATRHGEIIENEITEVTIAGTSDWWNAPYQKGGKE